MIRTALAMTLTDGVSVCDRFDAGCRLRLHDEASVFAPADVTAPASASLAPDAVPNILRQSAIAFLAFGNQAAPPDLDAVAPIMDMAIAAQGGFMAASFSHPAYGRTMFQGHLFQHGQLVANLVHALSERLTGRVALIAHDVVAAGPAAIRARVTAAREQGVALALIDAVDSSPQAAIREALSVQPLIGGPAWLLPQTQAMAAAAPGMVAQKTAILSGALDRQTLFQLGAAAQVVPLLRLDPAAPDSLAAANTWAAAQAAQNIIISTSVPPDRLASGVSSTSLLATIAANLAAAGWRRFVLNGNDTASAVLARLGITTLDTGAPAAGLRWLHSDRYSLLPKPGGFGGRDLFLDGFEPQIRLNGAVEWPA